MRIAFEWEDWKKEGKNERDERFFSFGVKIFLGRSRYKVGFFQREEARDTFWAEKTR